MKNIGMDIPVNVQRAYQTSVNLKNEIAKTIGIFLTN